MKKHILITSFSLIARVCFSQTPEDSVFYQKQYKPDVRYTLKTKEGTTQTGFIISETRDSIILDKDISHEKLALSKKSLEKINPVKTIAPAIRPAMSENPHAMNYLLSNSAFLFDEQRAATNSHWLLIENLNYAFTENWAIYLNTLAFYPVTLGVKCAFQLDNISYVGGHAFVIGNTTSDNNASLFWGYGALAKYTRGTSNKNFTISGGLLGINSEIFYTNPSTPFVNTGFVSAAYCNRFREGIALNLEGWFFPLFNSGIAGAGIKFVGNEYVCWSLGCYAFMNGYENTIQLNFKTLPVPYFGVARRFN